MKQYIVVIALLMAQPAALFAQPVKLGLKEAFDLALSDNKTIRAGHINTRMAGEYVKEKRGALLPEISVTLNYTAFALRPVIFLRGDAGSKQVVPTEVGGTHALGSAVIATYPLFDAQKLSDVKLASINARVERERTRDMSGKVVLEVAVTYLTVQFYQEQLALYTQSLERNLRALADSRHLFLQGKGLKTDTLRHYLDVQNLKASISGLQNEKANQLMHLRHLLGLDMDAEVELTDRLNTGAPSLLGNVDSLVTEALRGRPDLRMHEVTLEKARERLRAAKNLAKPTVNAFAQYQVQAQSDVLRFWNYGYPNTAFLGLQLSFPVYSGHRVRYKTAAANYEVQRAQEEGEDLKRRIVKELKALTGNLREAYLQTEMYAKTVELAQVNFQMVNERYKHGISTRLEVADAEVMLLQAKINYLRSVYTSAVTEFQIKNALGNL